MNDSQITVQQAILAKLTSNSSLMTLISGVFDTVPEQQAYPFVTIGEFTTVDDSTKGIDGLQHTVTIHTWDQSESRLRLKQVMALVVNLLHDQELALANSAHNLVNLRFEFSETYKDPDGYTLHGVQRFRIVTDEDA